MIRWLVTRYIRRSMCHERQADRDAIFRAIGEGIKETFTEDTFNGRMWFAVHELTKNMPEAVDGFRLMGKRIYHDAVNAAKSAEGGVMEAMQDVPVPDWRKEELRKQAAK